MTALTRMLRWKFAYLGASVHGGESVWGQVAGRTHGERVGNTEERAHAEDLGQVGAKTCEHEVGQKNLLLDLPRDVIHGAWVRQVEQRPPFREGVACILDRGHGGVLGHETER